MTDTRVKHAETAGHVTIETHSWGELGCREPAQPVRRPEPAAGFVHPSVMDWRRRLAVAECSICNLQIQLW